MAVKYAVEKFKIGFGKEKKEAYVGRIQLGETVDTDMIVEQIHLRTGMNKAQIKMVLENMTESIQHFAKMGNGVRLGGFGIVKPGIKTRSSEVEGEVKVVGLHYNFLPSVEMKEALREIDIRKLGESSGSDIEDDDEEDDGGNGGGGQEFT